jgi:hypothetical protein
VTFDPASLLLVAAAIVWVCIVFYAIACPDPRDQRNRHRRLPRDDPWQSDHRHKRSRNGRPLAGEFSQWHRSPCLRVVVVAHLPKDQGSLNDHPSI